MKLVEVKAYIIRDSPNTYSVQYKRGNKPIRCDSFQIKNSNGEANLIKDPINWVEDMSPIKVPRIVKPTHSYYFKDVNSIWVKVGHSMDVLKKHVQDTQY